MPKNEFDLAVIGSGPAGQKAAIQASKLGKSVVLIDMNPLVGGNCLHDGTIPSKSFREAIINLSGARLRSYFGEAFRVKHNIEMADLTRWSASIVANIEQTTRSQLIRNKVKIICGVASIKNEHELIVRQKNIQETISADFIVMATGTRPRHPEGFEFDNEVILDSTGILHIKKLPRSLAVVGGGVIGAEYASMFATVGVEVTLIEARPWILNHVDNDMREALSYYLRQQRATILLNEKVVKCRRSPDGRAMMFLDSGKRIVTDVLLVSAGRVGNTAELNLDAVGIECSPECMVKVNQSYQTSVPNIYAVGDLAGRPGLASTAIEQGRAAACHAFGLEDPFADLPHPYGIYSIPEIAMVGRSEAELTQAKVRYETGVVRFGDLERGKILGGSDGMLKLIFNPENQEILGVHIVGEGATEIIHIGQAVMAQKGTLGMLVHMVFNYPTLAYAYKVAALDAFNKIVDTKGLPYEV
jgi:NAD(P) transhydrogenase